MRKYGLFVGQDGCAEKAAFYATSEVRELPFEAHYLMHRHNTNMTLGNYSYLNNKWIGGELEERKKKTGIVSHC